MAGYVAHTRPLGAGRAQGRQRRAQVAGGGRGVEPRRERRRGDAAPALGGGTSLHAAEWGAPRRAVRRARRASVQARAGRETRRRSTAATARVARATFERLRRNVGRGQGRIGRATGARRRGVGTTRPGSGGCCRMASAFPNPADAWATVSHYHTPSNGAHGPQIHARS